MTHMRLIPIHQDLHDAVQGLVGTVVELETMNLLYERGFVLSFTIRGGRTLTKATHPAGIKPATW